MISLHLIYSLLDAKFLFISYAYVSIESTDYILLSSFEIEAILLIYSVNIYYFSLLSICCVFNISLWFLQILFDLL